MEMTYVYKDKPLSWRRLWQYIKENPKESICLPKRTHYVLIHPLLYFSSFFLMVDRYRQKKGVEKTQWEIIATRSTARKEKLITAQEKMQGMWRMSASK